MTVSTVVPDNVTVSTVVPDNELIDQFMDTSNQRALSFSSRTDKKRVVRSLSAYLDGRGLLAASTEDISAWLAKVGPSRNATYKYLGRVHSFYLWASVEKLIGIPPTRALRSGRITFEESLRGETVNTRSVFTTTLGPLSDQYLLERRKRGEISLLTYRNGSYHLEGLAATFGARPLEQFGPAAVERWLETVGHLSPATRRARLSSVRMFCRWLVKRKLIRRDPTIEVAAIRQPRPVERALSGDDVARLLAVLPDNRAGAIVWLMVGLGLRCCEVANLEVGDYDQKAATLVVKGKGGNMRLLPVTAEVAEALTAYMGEIGRTFGPLIRSYRPHQASQSLRSDTISGMVGEWILDAGIKVRRRDGVSAHALRHTAASDTLDQCQDLRIVQAMLGHVNLATTAIYLRRAKIGEMREAMGGRRYELAPPVAL